MSEPIFDMSWREPTVPQLKALEYVYDALYNKTMPALPKGITHHFLVMSRVNARALAVDSEQYKAEVFKLNEYDLAELMLMSKSSLWYTQALSWSKQNPSFAPITWQAACKFLIEVVDLGYNEETQQWWDVSGMDAKHLNFGLLMLLDLANMLKQIRGKSLSVYSQGFENVIPLIVTKTRLKQLRKHIKNLKGGDAK